MIAWEDRTEVTYIPFLHHCNHEAVTAYFQSTLEMQGQAFTGLEDRVRAQSELAQHWTATNLLLKQMHIVEFMCLRDLYITKSYLN